MYPEASPELVARARRDGAAFGEIYDLYLRRVYGFCLTHTKDIHEAEDVTAQTFERALNAIGRYEERGVPFSAWLLQIAARLLINRGKQRSRTVLLGDDPIAEEQDDADDDPQVWVERWERALWLRALVRDLPPDQQQAVRLRYWEGLSVAETAARMGRNENAMKQLLHRAVTRLRADAGNRDV